MVGRNSPEAQAASRSSRAASILPNSSGSSSPAAASTRAWAREAAMSYGASRQSNWTLTDSRARASAGPPENRPPHSEVFSVTTLSLPAAGHGRPARSRDAPFAVFAGVAGPVGEFLGERLAPDDVAGHDENGVVAGDGADDIG